MPNSTFARHHLENGGRAGAIALFERILAAAPADPLVRVTISGALGNAGAFDDLVRLIAPRYDASTDTRFTGLNLAQALDKLGRTEEAADVMASLERGGQEQAEGPDEPEKAKEAEIHAEV